jgi:hypothetical protein
VADDATADGVPARRWGALSPEEQRALELEENLHRKDLTSYECSKTLVDLVEAVRAMPTCGNSPHVASSHPGPARTPGSYRDVADRTGIPVRTLRHAEQHVAAVQEFPELAGVSQHEALEVARELRQAPKEQQMAVRATETCAKFAQVSEPSRGPARAQGELRSNLERNSRGHPAEPASYREVAERTGIPVATIRLAEPPNGFRAKFARNPQGGAPAGPETCGNFPQVSHSGRGPATTPGSYRGGGQDGGPAGGCAKFAHPPSPGGEPRNA